MVWKDNQFFKCFKSQCWDGILICIYHKDVRSGLFQRLNPRVMAFQATIQGYQPRASIVSYRTTAMFWLYAWCYLFLYERQRCMYMRVFRYAYPVCAAARGGDQVLCSITLILEAGSLNQTTARLAASRPRRSSCPHLTQYWAYSQVYDCAWLFTRVWVFTCPLASEERSPGRLPSGSSHTCILSYWTYSWATSSRAELTTRHLSILRARC